MQTRILEILNEICPGVDFGESKDFFEDSLLDSFDIITFVECIESEYNIEFDGDDIVPDNFLNLEAIENVIGKYV